MLASRRSFAEISSVDVVPCWLRRSRWLMLSRLLSHGAIASTTPLPGRTLVMRAASTCDRQERVVQAVDVNRQMVCGRALVWLPTVDIAAETSRARPPSWTNRPNGARDLELLSEATVFQGQALDG